MQLAWRRFRNSRSSFTALSLRDTSDDSHLVLCPSMSLLLMKWSQLGSYTMGLCLCGRNRRLCGVSLMMGVYFTCSAYLLCTLTALTCLCVCVVCIQMFCMNGGVCRCLPLHVWQPPCPRRCCCHMLAASVRAEHKPWLRRDLLLCVFVPLLVVLLPTNTCIFPAD